MSSGVECKLVMLGGGGVGKSALTLQFVNGIFVEKYDPTIEDSFRKQVTLDNNYSYLLDILDTAGQEEFDVMRDQYIRGGEVFIIVYSATDQNSFIDAKDFYENVLRVKDKPSWPVVIAGNKVDLVDQRVVSNADGAALAVKCGNAPFFETSAKTVQNVSQIFLAAVRLVKMKDPPPTAPTGGTGGTGTTRPKERRKPCTLL